MIQISKFLSPMKKFEVVRKDTNGNVPEDRLIVIARNRKMSEHAKELLSAQASLNNV
ncbi:hypothetical protein D3C78_687090 [compost metagenome]